ncbi:MAG: Gldg family protein [Gammaproteobacteria bacterium]|jgi:ABC-type uncharacterized transport system involved in gliding motility auxiliary subunit|nr:hypothetical protein [Chromatiales bacterium]MCP4925783.1 hypothetical protein [Gammaproteobacteria bacterium]MDP7296018.1 Gldg family protein [Gammaproteobacteria bacterium]MDP7419223.1 Gldg family protein [Gammaproteobacteria bacterium]MDP7659842.1 Gldg family protein [Gammaproteobacteria bacterium]
MSNSKMTLGRAGLVTVATIFIIAVAVSNTMFRGMRLDLTENSLYTLSAGTKNILGNINEPINLYFFYSDRATAEISQLRTYAGRVREMLEEFVAQSGGRLRVTVIDPLPFSEDEDRAAAFGLQAISLGGATDAIYMGIAGTNSIDDVERITFLDPGKETFLEYELARLVDTLADPQRPVVGLISGLPIRGSFNPATQRRSEPWIVMTQIEQLFEIRELTGTTTTIDPEVNVLFVVHPKELPDATLYAIDQFILGGGRALLMVDPYAETDMPPQDPNNPAAALLASHASDLNRLIETWGLSVAADEYIADERFALQITGFDAQPIRHIGLLGIDQTAIDRTDIVSAELHNLNLGYPGFITVTADTPVDVMPLIRSSDSAAPLTTSGLAFIRDPAQLRQGFAATGEQYTMAARIRGTVSSAFADGPPDGFTTGDHSIEHLATSNGPVNVILIADTDILTDRLWAQVQNFFGQRISTAFAGNGDFIINSLDNLTGSGDLISVRARATFTRPFTRVQNLQREAESRFRQTEERLQQELSDTEMKLSELQASRKDVSTTILSPEQETELQRFQQQRLRIRKELRQVQRNLDQQIEDLGTWLKVINIGLVPFAITILSITALLLRRNRQQQNIQHSTGA